MLLSGGEEMKADRTKVALAMAKRCFSIADIVERSGLTEATVKNVIYGKKSVLPATFGKVARALEVDVEEILSNKSFSSQ